MLWTNERLKREAHSDEGFCLGYAEKKNKQRMKRVQTEINTPEVRKQHD